MLTFIEKRDKPALKNLYYTSDGEIFGLTMMYFLKKFRKVQVTFSKKSRKISLQSKRISKRRSGSLCIDERREIILRKREFLQVAPNYAAFWSCIITLVVLYLDGTVLSFTTRLLRSMLAS